jgi:hypothetical protein
VKLAHLVAKGRERPASVPMVDMREKRSAVPA